MLAVDGNDVDVSKPVCKVRGFAVSLGTANVPSSVYQDLFGQLKYFPAIPSPRIYPSSTLSPSPTVSPLPLLSSPLPLPPTPPHYAPTNLLISLVRWLDSLFQSIYLRDSVRI